MYQMLFMMLLLFVGTIANVFMAIVEYRDKNRNVALGWACVAAFALGAFFQHLSNLLKYMS